MPADVLDLPAELVDQMAERSQKKPGPAKDPDSLRSKGVPRHKHPRKAFHAEQELFDALAAFRASFKEFPPDESDVLRQALKDYLTARGFWPPPKRPGKP